MKLNKGLNLLYDITNQNQIIQNDYCPHIFNHFLNPLLNSKYQKLNIPDHKTPKDNNQFYFRNLSILQNPINSFKYYGINQSKNLINDFFIKNFNLDWIILNNPQNLSYNSMNREGCIFTFNFNIPGSLLASSNQNPCIEIWDMKNKKLKCTLNSHKEIITGIEFFHNNPINNFFLSCSLDKTIKLWKNYENVHTFIEHNDWVRCMAIREDDSQFLSGCVSSVVKLWDIHTQTVIGNIVNQNPDPNSLSTVNSLGFMKKNPNLFVVGLRSGEVKIFDSRSNNNNIGLVNCFKAHYKKLNTVKLNNSDNYLLTSGRDSLLRLWDVRKLPNVNDDEKSIINNRKYINEYNKHKCNGYNIECNYFLNEKYLITGSENNNIYVYNTLNPEDYFKIPTQQKCINLIKPVPNSYSFAFTGLQDISIFIWSPRKNINKCFEIRYNENFKKADEYNEEDDFNNYYEEEDKNQQFCSKVVEEIMAECGDMILKIFHNHNLTYSNGISFENLIEIIQKSKDEKSMEIIQNINQKLIGRFMQEFANNYLKRDDKKGKKEIKKMKEKEEIKYNKIKCSECETLKTENNVFNTADRNLVNELLVLPNKYNFNINKENLKNKEKGENFNICDNVNNKEVDLVQEDKNIISRQMRGFLFI